MSPASRFLTKTFSWRDPWLYPLIPPGLIFYAIVALVVRKKARIEDATSVIDEVEVAVESVQQLCQCAPYSAEFQVELSGIVNARKVARFFTASKGAAHLLYTNTPERPLTRA